MATGAGRQLAAQHSHSLECWYAHVPGLKVLAPATLEDARGMLWPALQDPNPVVIFEHVLLYNVTGPVPEPAGPVAIDKAAIRRPGRDVTLVTYGGSLPKTLQAATELAVDGIEAEVIDLRSLRPIDTDTIVASVARTRRAVIVDEGWRMANAVASQALRDVSRRSRCAALTGTDLHARRVLRHDRVLRGMSRSYFSQHERGNEYLVRSRLSSLLSGSPNR